MSVPWIGVDLPVLSGEKWMPEVVIVGDAYFIWNGITYEEVELLGWWDGTALQTVEVLGWWNGFAIEPIGSVV